jgi:hypothetical protein
MDDRFPASESGFDQFFSIFEIDEFVPLASSSLQTFGDHEIKELVKQLSHKQLGGAKKFWCTVPLIDPGKEPEVRILCCFV